jgi:hypothetical protein
MFSPPVSASQTRTMVSANSFCTCFPTPRNQAVGRPPPTHRSSLNSGHETNLSDPTNIFLSCILTIYLWLYSLLLGTGRFCSFWIVYTVGRTRWTGDQPVPYGHFPADIPSRSHSVYRNLIRTILTKATALFVSLRSLTGGAVHQRIFVHSVDRKY